MINVILKKILQQWQLILIVILLIVCFTSIRSCKINSDRADIEIHKNDSSFKIAKYYRDKNGQLIGQVNTHELTVKNLKEYGDQLGFENKSLKKQVGNLNNLVAHWQGKAGVADTIRTVVHDTTYVDRDGETVTAQTFKWKNKFMDLEGIIVTDSLTLRYLYNVDFALTAYRKPQGGFWKPPGQLVADVKFNDPSFKVTEFKGFVITEPRKKWYETKGFAIGAGFLLGYAATKK